MKVNTVQSYNACNNRDGANFKGYVHPKLMDSFYKTALDQIKVDSPLIEEGVQRIKNGEFKTFKEYLEGNRENIINYFFKPVFDAMKKLPDNICLNKVNTRVNQYNFETQDVFALCEDKVNLEKLACRSPHSTPDKVSYSYDHYNYNGMFDMYGRYGYILSPNKYTAEQLECWIENYGWPEFQDRFGC